MKRFTSSLFIFLNSASLLAGTCAMCRKSLESGGSAGLLEGFYWSIIVIGTIPLLVIGGLGWLLYRSYHPKSTPPSA